MLPAASKQKPYTEIWVDRQDFHFFIENWWE